MSLDFADVVGFARDLDGAGAKVTLAARQVVKKGAVNVKKRLQSEASGVEHAPGLPRAISFDVELSGDEIVADIGPETGGAGSLALLYLGNSKTGPRLPDPVLAADSEAEVMAGYLADAGVESVG